MRSWMISSRLRKKSAGLFESHSRFGLLSSSAISLGRISASFAFFLFRQLSVAVLASGCKRLAQLAEGEARALASGATVAGCPRTLAPTLLLAAALVTASSDTASRTRNVFCRLGGFAGWTSAAALRARRSAWRLASPDRAEVPIGLPGGLR